MGMFRRKDATDEGVFLKPKTRIGRDADNDIVIPRASVSAHHASLSWSTSGWVLRDMSTYGTLVNGGLVKGAAQPLRAGDALTFVEADEVWILEDSAAPGLLLRRLDGREPAIHVDHDDGLRAFPSASSPIQTLLRVGAGWFVESDTGTRRTLVDGSTIELGGERYAVSVPPPLVQTAEPEDPATPWSLATARMEIFVLRGEDEAELTIRCEGIERAVKPSRPLYLLAYLAEQRIEAAAKGGQDDGWIPAELACSALGVDRTVFNVDVHRVREAIKSTGLANAANVVERRPSQIRIGVPPARCSVSRR